MRAKPIQAPEQLRLALASHYFAWVRSGRKQMTTRRGILHTHAGEGLVLHAAGAELACEVTGQHFRTLVTLSERDAELEGFVSLDELRAALLVHYPGLVPGEVLTCIHLRPTS